MRTLNFIWLPLLLTACTCASSEQPATPEAKESLQEETVSTPASSAPAEEALVHLRGLFYYERATNSGVVGFPKHPEYSERRGPGEQAWLEVHSSGAKHAYAFALFDDGRILSLWKKDIDKSEHTPPMNAFGNGLPLGPEYDTGATLLVIAGEQALIGLEEMGDCTQQETQACSNIRRIAEEGTSSANSPDKPLRMKHMDIVTGAAAASNSGEGRCAIAFKIRAAI